jgi:hypothetical protein
MPSAVDKTRKIFNTINGGEKQASSAAIVYHDLPALF